MTTFKRLLLLVPFLLLLVPSNAFANSAWWHLTAQTRPAVLRQGGGADEVQALTVSANGGELVLLSHGVPVADVSFEASDGELAAALEVIYGAENVEVTGGPGTLEGGTYRVRFVKALAERAVEPIEVDKSSVGGVELTCNGAPCPGNVSVQEVERSRPDGQIAIVAANLGDASLNGTSAPITIEAQLPPDLEAVHIYGESSFRKDGPVLCSLSRLRCRLAEPLSAYEQIEVYVDVDVKSEAQGGGVFQASVSGGEVRGETVHHQV